MHGMGVVQMTNYLALATAFRTTCDSLMKHKTFIMSSFDYIKMHFTIKFNILLYKFFVSDNYHQLCYIIKICPFFLQCSYFH